MKPRRMVRHECSLCCRRRSSRKRVSGPEDTLDRFICSRPYCGVVKGVLRGFLRPILTTKSRSIRDMGNRSDPGGGADSDGKPAVSIAELPGDECFVQEGQNQWIRDEKETIRQSPFEMPDTGKAELTDTSRPQHGDAQVYRPFTCPRSPSPPPVRLWTKPALSTH